MRISKIHKRNEKFNISGNVDTSGVTIDAKLAENYSARVIEYAKILKAKNGTAYSDEYYLNHAKSIDNREMKGAYAEVFNKKAALCPIQDPQWAGFSYEEIIQMENSGYKIPEEVLLWAHAQQESDVVAYEIVSDDMTTDDNSSTEDITGDSELNNLQKKAKEYILKSENAQEEAQQKIEEFQVLADKANQIKKEKENSYKDSMQEVINLTNEWKQLDKKSKSSTLSDSDQKRYSELSKQLGNNGSAKKEMQIESEDLDKLLSTMNLLNTDTTEDISLAQDTTKAGVDLANFKKGYNSNQATHNTSGIVFSNMGLLDDVLYGVSGSTIQRIAIDTGRDLETLSNSTINSLNSNENTELIKFATEYTAEMDKTEQYTKDAMGGNYTNPEQKVFNEPSRLATTETKSGNTSKKAVRLEKSKNNKNKSTQDATIQEDEPKNEYGKNPDFFVLPFGGRPSVALAATVTSAISTANLKKKQSKVDDTEKLVQSNLKKAQASIKKLNQETDKAKKKHEANLQQAREYSDQLANLDAMTLAALQAAPKQKQPVKNTQQEGQQEETQAPTQNTQELYPLQAETEAVVAQMSSLSAKDALEVAKMKRPIAQTEATLLKTQKSNNIFHVQNGQLTERNKNNKTVSINTLICGGMTIGVGAWNLAQSIPLIGFIPTHAMGVALAAFASLQLATGAGASAAGTVGLIASGDASDDIKDNEKNFNETGKTNTEIKKEIWAVQKTVGQFKGIAVPETISAGQIQQNNPQTTEQKDSNSTIANNNATSRTETKTFAQIKDINNIPNGPTNLSDPLNNTKKAQGSPVKEIPPTNEKQDNNTPTAAATSANEAKPAASVARTAKTAPAVNNSAPTPVTVPTQTRAQAQAQTQTPVQTPAPAARTAQNTNKTQQDNTQMPVNNIQNASNKPEENNYDKINNILKANMEKSQRIQNQVQALSIDSENKNTDNDIDNIAETQNESENTDNTTTESIVTDKNNNLNLISKNLEEVQAAPDEEQEEENNFDIEETQASEEIQEEQATNDETQEDTIVLAASATTSANIKDNITTDDKATRKLERFNNDSIIESKKKKKKVMAVSAASGGSVKG